MHTKNLLTIQKFAEACRTTPRAIRLYEELGLLTPVYVDKFTKYRYFDPEQARDIFQIKLMQNFQVPLKEMKELVENSSSYFFLEKQVKKIKEEIEEKKKELDFLKSVKEFVVEEKEGKALKNEVVGPYILLCMIIPRGRYDRLDEYADKLYRHAKRWGVKVSNKYFVFYRDPYRYRPNDSAMEVGIICKSTVLPRVAVFTPAIYVRRFKRQKVQMYTYKGPFEYLTFVHKRMVEMTKEVGKKKRLNIKEYPFDLYVHGPWDTKSEFEYVTKVGYPVK